MKDKDEMVGDCLDWCNAEFKERTSSANINPGEAWKLRASVWEEFLVDCKFDYTYNMRINGKNQLGLVIAELAENPDSRQAVVHVHYPQDSSHMRKNRIPCSMYYQFMVRRGKLDIIYNMRSSDFDTHFKNDIWLADELRKYVASFLGIEVGLLYMNVGSLHRYKNYTTKHVF